MLNIHPLSGETATNLLRRSLAKRFLLLNVACDGSTTSGCFNVKSDGSAAWRKKEQDRRLPLNLDSPGFSLTDRTLVLSYDEVNALANNFQSVFEAMPAAAVDNGRVALGNLHRDKADMGRVLAELERRTDDLLAIRDALTVSLDTRLHALKRSVPHDIELAVGDRLTDYAIELLAAFSDSRPIYDRLPALRGFGTDNALRGRDLPNKGDARLRYFLQHHPGNPLGAVRPLDYVAHELKPLHIADALEWNCGCDPRTESVDLLLSLDGSPVVTEVKMAGDKFVSSAVVQLLYYASILAGDRQRTRLTREIGPFARPDLWLCVIAEERDETKSNEAGFTADLGASLTFLRHADTRRVLGPFFAGAAVMVIREAAEPDGASRGPAFRVTTGEEHHIAWVAGL